MEALVGLMLLLAFLGTLDLGSLKPSLQARKVYARQPVYRAVTLKSSYDSDQEIYQ